MTTASNWLLNFAIAYATPVSLLGTRIKLPLLESKQRFNPLGSAPG